MDCSPPGSSVHRITPARILEWAAISSSKGLSQPRDQIEPASPVAPALAGGDSLSLSPLVAKVSTNLDLKLKRSQLNARMVSYNFNDDKMNRT